MKRSTRILLLVASFAWVLLVGAGAVLTYPSVGQIAGSVDPTMFWSVETTGVPASPLQVSLKTASWLAWTLAPVVLMWVVALVLGRRPRGEPA